MRKTAVSLVGTEPDILSIRLRFQYVGRFFDFFELISSPCPQELNAIRFRKLAVSIYSLQKK